MSSADMLGDWTGGGMGSALGPGRPSRLGSGNVSALSAATAVAVEKEAGSRCASDTSCSAVQNCGSPSEGAPPADSSHTCARVVRGSPDR